MVDVHFGNPFDKGVVVILVGFPLKHFCGAVQVFIVMLGDIQDLQLVDFNFQ